MQNVHLSSLQGIMNMFNNNYEITRGDYGPHLCMFSGWSDSVEKMVKKRGILELELNYAKGWPCGTDLSFLKNLKHLKSFELLDYEVTDVSVINELSELRELKINSSCNNFIDFSKFPNLEDISMEWFSNSRPLFDCITLKRVFINCCDIADLSVFRKLVNLEYLSLKSPKIKNIGDISSLRNLEVLELGNAKNLTSLQGVEVLKNLKVLEIQRCRKLMDIDPIKHLRKLERLFICNCGSIQSLKPLEGLPELREVHFYESTNIVDGDLAVLKRLPKIEDTSFQDRKHYNLTFYELNPKGAVALKKALRKYSGTT